MSCNPTSHPNTEDGCYLQETYSIPGIILNMGSANEMRRYYVTLPLIGGAHTQNDSCNHYSDVIMGAMASEITSLTNVYSTVYSGADQRKHQSSASLAFVRGIHRGPVNSPHKWPVTRKMFPFDDVIMTNDWRLRDSNLKNSLCYKIDGHCPTRSQIYA